MLQLRVEITITLFDHDYVSALLTYTSASFTLRVPYSG